MKTLVHWYLRWRRHLASIDAHLDYPDIMAPPLPRGTDCRGQIEMQNHWETRRKMLVKRKEIMDASADVNNAGFVPVNLELFDHD